MPGDVAVYVDRRGFLYSCLRGGTRVGIQYA
jgi:hypothetical protein